MNLSCLQACYWVLRTVQRKVRRRYAEYHAIGNADGRDQTGRTGAPVPQPCIGAAGGEPLDARRRHRLAVLAVTPFAGGSALFAVGAILLLCRRRRRSRPAARAASARPIGRGARDGGGLDGLSAQNLAAAVTDPLIIFDAAGTAVHANDAARVGLRRARAGHVAAAEIPRARDAGRRSSACARAPCRFRGRRLCRARSDRARLQGHRLGRSAAAPGFSSSSSRTRARRGASTACAPTSSPMPATSCARRSPRSPASSRRCAAPRGTIAAARDHFLGIMQNQTARMARLIDDLLSLSRLEMKPYLPPGATVDVRADRPGRDRFAEPAREGIRRRHRADSSATRRSRCAATATNCSRCSRTCSRTPANTASRAGASSSRSTRPVTPDPEVAVDDPRFRAGHPGRAYSAHHRAVLPRRCRHQPRAEGHRAWPCHRQAHPDPPQCAADDQVGSRRGGGLHGASAGEVSATWGWDDVPIAI